MKSGLVDDRMAIRAVPPESVQTGLGSTLLKHYADGIRESNRVVRRVGRQEEHVALADDNVAEGAIIDDFEHHGALVLVEPFGRLINVVVGAGVWPADDHDCEIFIVDAVVIDRRLQQVGVLLQPFRYIQRACKHGDP